MTLRDAPKDWQLSTGRTAARSGSSRKATGLRVAADVTFVVHLWMFRDTTARADRCMNECLVRSIEVSQWWKVRLRRSKVIVEPSALRSSRTEGKLTVKGEPPLTATPTPHRHLRVRQVVAVYRWNMLSITL